MPAKTRRSQTHRTTNKTRRTNKTNKRPQNQHSRLYLKSILVLVLLLAAGGLIHHAFYPPTPKLPSPPLKTLAARRSVELGLHASNDRLKDTPFSNITKSQFSFINSDGEGHWLRLWPAKNRFNFSMLDQFVDYAQKNHLQVQVHHLVWGEKDSLPGWLKKGNYTPQQLLDFMKQGITTEVSRYRGRVNEWTVVNEAFSRSQHMFNLTDWWADHVGGKEAYLDKAFIWAHQADPSAKLILNDFGNETAGPVSNAEYTYIKAARARGVPINGFGIQLHINAAHPPNFAGMVDNINRFAAIGVPTYITEFDVTMNDVKGSAQYKDQLQAKITAQAVQACLISKSCVSFNVFGLTDKSNWLKSLTHTKSRSYLMTSRYQPKPVFYAFRQAWLPAAD